MLRKKMLNIEYRWESMSEIRIEAILIQELSGTQDRSQVIKNNEFDKDGIAVFTCIDCKKRKNNTKNV
jgi:hypothetical protein